MKKILIILSLVHGVLVSAQSASLDTSFDPSQGADATVTASAVLPNGKILIGGDFFTFNGQTANKIVRLNSNGSVDNTFNVGTGANGRIWNIAVQTDGKVILVGDFTQFNGITKNRIVRLNQDGSLDNTFNIGTGANNPIYAIHIQSDNKILIGGLFVNFNGISKSFIARLNADGSIDNTFNSAGGGANQRVWSIKTQADGKIIIGGWFTTYQGTTCNRIARLNVNGSLDGTFLSGTAADDIIYTLNVDQNDRIYIGGDFTTYNNVSNNRIARLNANGTLDGTFNVGQGVNATVYDIDLSAQGQVYVTGHFLTYNSAAGKSLVRLDLNGNRDTQFGTGNEFNNIAYTASLQPDGKILVGGDFDFYNGVSRPRILRLNTCSPVSNMVTLSSCVDFTWDNGQTYTQSGLYQHTYTSVAGCDSTVTLGLTIRQPNSGYTAVSSCSNYTWTNNQTYTQSGIYTQVLSNIHGCDSIDTLDLTINTVSTPVVSLDTLGSLQCDLSASSYQWFYCSSGIDIPGATNSSYTPIENGLYAVTISDANGCESTSDCFTYNITNIESVESASLIIFPNPTNGIFEIKGWENFTLVILDPLGKEVRSYKSNHSDTFNISDLPKGVYFLRLNQMNQSILGRIELK